MWEGDNRCRAVVFSEKIEMKYVQGIWSGNYEYLKSKNDEKKLTSIPNKKHLQSALNKLEMVIAK